MMRIQCVVWLVSLVSYSLADLNVYVSDLTITDHCSQQARNCALALEYSKCSEVISRENECSIRTICSNTEFNNIYDLACRGEELLAALTKRLDATCVKRLESPDCDLGLRPMTIFDYGNISKQHHLCDKVQTSPIAKCLSGNVDYKLPDCTQQQFGSIVNLICGATGGVGITRLDICLFYVSLCLCVLVMTPVSLESFLLA